MNLSLEFDSVAEMQDWILAEAKVLTVQAVENATAGGETVITGALSHDPVPEPAPEPKPKRKRRTKAEMAAARAAEEKKQAAAAPEPTPASTKPEAEAAPEPPAEVEADAAPAAAGGNGTDETAELQARFKVFLAKDPHAAVAELDRVVGREGKFGQCAVEVQREILAVLEARQ